MKKNIVGITELQKFDDMTLVSVCPICEKEYVTQTSDGYDVQQNNDLGFCSLCFIKLKKIINEGTL